MRYLFAAILFLSSNGHAQVDYKKLCNQVLSPHKVKEFENTEVYQRRILGFPVEYSLDELKYLSDLTRIEAIDYLYLVKEIEVFIKDSEQHTLPKIHLPFLRMIKSPGLYVQKMASNVRRMQRESVWDYYREEVNEYNNSTFVIAANNYFKKNDGEIVTDLIRPFGKRNLIFLEEDFTRVELLYTYLVVKIFESEFIGMQKGFKAEIASKYATKTMDLMIPAIVKTRTEPIMRQDFLERLVNDEVDSMMPFLIAADLIEKHQKELDFNDTELETLQKIYNEKFRTLFGKLTNIRTHLEKRVPDFLVNDNDGSYLLMLTMGVKKNIEVNQPKSAL